MAVHSRRRSCPGRDIVPRVGYLSLMGALLCLPCPPLPPIPVSVPMVMRPLVPSSGSADITGTLMVLSPQMASDLLKNRLPNRPLVKPGYGR